jgi:hypothetical protein
MICNVTNGDLKGLGTRIFLKFVDREAAFDAGFNDYVVDREVFPGFARQRLTPDHATSYIAGQREARRELSRQREREQVKVLTAAGLPKHRVRERMERIAAKRLQRARDEAVTRNDRLLEVHPDGVFPFRPSEPPGMPPRGSAGRT